jgi:hypothetical protein
MVKELHPRQYRRLGYWLTLLMMLVIFYLQRFTHLVGQSLFLSVRTARETKGGQVNEC